ncbi:hypothetical protein HDU79_009946 [Rhizoclosmatium sp. JEL0117]|nr:hypothetical protein HDU99_004590 [Rhizoclosmatium hyalinum]KAJ3282414.1 hypothetical protein HDU79_009946 [Rhizoclosmatium sp. JEL0117]
MAQDSKRRIGALDTVLFNGTEAVSAFIAKVESVYVVPVLPSNRRFHKAWTHSGILVDKNVLPLPCLEEGKLYIYESILCGNILGYEYSKVMSVDQEINPKFPFHIGPQIREWIPVVEEVGADVAVFRLSDEERDRLLVKNIESTRKTMLDFYNGHKDWGYPLNPLPQFAAASNELYAALTAFRSRFEAVVKNLPGSAKLLEHSKEIFCSEMVAKLYMDLEVEGFCEAKKPKLRRLMHYTEFTPLDLEVMEVLRGASSSRAIYAKLKGKVFFDLESDKNGHDLLPVDLDLQKVAFPYLAASKDHWIPASNGKIPSGIVPSGYTSDGHPVYISRAVIGPSLNIGYTDNSGQMKTGWEGVELKIEYDHEVLNLTAQTDFEWVRSGKLLLGNVPRSAIVGGCDSEGKPYYIARCRFTEPGSSGIGSLLVGPVSPGLNGARFVLNGKEVAKAGEYEVLCRKTHFLERLFFGLGTDHFLVLLVAVLFYVLGQHNTHQLVLDALVPSKKAN